MMLRLSLKETNVCSFVREAFLRMQADKQKKRQQKRNEASCMNVCDDAFWKQGRCFEWIFPSSFLPSVASSSLDDSMCWLFPVLTHRIHFSYDGPSMLLLSSYFQCCCVNWSRGRLNWFLNHQFYGNSECEFTSRSRSRFFWRFHLTQSHLARFGFIPYFHLLAVSRLEPFETTKKNSFTMELNTYDSFFRLLDEFWTFFFSLRFFIVSVWAGDWIQCRCDSVDARGDEECT